MYKIREDLTSPLLPFTWSRGTARPTFLYICSTTLETSKLRPWRTKHVREFYAIEEEAFILKPEYYNFYFDYKVPTYQETIICV